MPCAFCGRWAYCYQWYRCDVFDDDWKDFCYDTDGSADYWILACKPSCRANAAQHAATQINDCCWWYHCETMKLTWQLRAGVDEVLAEMRRAGSE